MRFTPVSFFRACAAFAALLAVTAYPAAPRTAPEAPPEDTAQYQHLIDATSAVVGVKVKAIANARSNQNLGAERSGSGVLFAPQGLVLTIGYLILEADTVEITTASGRSVPATVAAYDHATGFGLLKPLGPLGMKPIELGSSSKLDIMDRVLVAAGGDADNNLSVATVVSKRSFAGYWEYLLDEAIFTAPPRPDFGGAALINHEGQLVGIGSLFVMDAMSEGERMPGNMFVPIDLLKPVLEEMIATGQQKGGRRPWIGLSSVEEDGRIKVVRVSVDGPAEKAGLEPGDILLSLDGEKLGNLPDFYRKLWSVGKPGTDVTMKVLKGTDVQDVKIHTIDRIELMRKRPTI
jgi:S1-C subfamily serine protease